MKPLLLTLLSLCFICHEITAQLIFSGTRSTIGSMQISDCSYELYGLPMSSAYSDAYTDVALTPDGRILGVRTLFRPDDSIKESYLIAIDPENSLSGDTLLVLDNEQIVALTCSSDYTVYLGESGVFTYNLITEELNYLGATPNTRVVIDMVWYQGELYGSTVWPNLSGTQPPQFIRYGGLDDGTISFNSTLITTDFPRLQGLTSVYDYENERLRIIGNSAIRSYIVGQRDTSILHEIFLEDTTYTTLCEVVIDPNDRRMTGLTSGDEFRTNFQLQLDLDEDDSSGRFIDHHQTDGLCTRSFLLSDQDVRIRSTLGGVDSLLVELAVGVHPAGEEVIVLEEVTGFQLIGNNTPRLRIVPDDPTDISALEALVPQLRLFIAGDALQTGERRVDLRLYSSEQSSDVAMAYIYPQPDIIPYSGEDYSQGVCAIDEVNLFAGLGEEVYPEGYWWPELRNSGNIYYSNFSEPGIYHYIVQEGSCGPDTARVTVTEFPQLVYNYGGEVNDVQVVYLCPGDTVTWQADTTVLLDWEWDVEPYEAPAITITEAGTYDLLAIDTNGCNYYMITSFRDPEWEEAGPGTQVDTVARCEGTILSFFGNSVTSDTTICVLIPSTSDCDLNYCRTFEFTPSVEVMEMAAICEGEVYNWRGQSYTVAGSYQQIIDATLPMCDTIANLELVVNPVYERNLIANLIPGGSFSVGDSVLTEAGFYSILLQSNQGCDSLINVQLETPNSIFDPLADNCKIPTLLHKGQNDWQLDCPSSIRVRDWQLYDAQGRKVPTNHPDGNILLQSNEQVRLSVGVYFYRIEYEWNGEKKYTSGKVVML